MTNPWLRRTAYLAALAPVLTDALERGEFPSHPREVLTEAAAGLLLALFVFLRNRETRRLERLASTDALTGLGNRRRFRFDLDRAVARASRRGSRLSLVYLDVDGFKAVNDTLGHPEGDRILQRVAAQLRRSVRAGTDRCYRLGGDEFAVVLGEGDSPPAPALHGRLEGALRGAVASAKTLVHLSMGVACFRPGDTADDLIFRADRLMYEAKSRTGGGVPAPVHAFGGALR